MKKIVFVVLVLCVAIASAFAAYYSHGLKWVGYLGATVQQSSVSGLKNARLSDYQYYGSREGSLYLPLESANGNRLLYGAVIGARTFAAEHLSVLSEVEYSYGGSRTYAINANVGGAYYFVDSSLHVGIGAKVGYFIYNVYLGQASILPGTTPPVILPQGTIRTGDVLIFSIMGVNLNPFLDISVDMGSSFEIGASVGYQIGYSFKSSLTANRISIDPATSGAYYDPESPNFVRISMTPKASLNGITAQLYGRYKF